MVTTTAFTVYTSSHISRSLQRFHEVWTILIVVQISRAIVSCSIPRRFHPFSAQEIYATLRAASGKLSGRCKESETMSCKWILAQRRTLDGRRNFSICSRKQGVPTFYIWVTSNFDVASSDFIHSSDISPVYPKTTHWMGHIPRDGRNQKDANSYYYRNRGRLVSPCLFYYLCIFSSKPLLRLLDYGHKYYDKHGSKV